MIFHNKKAKIPVIIAKNFSKIVFAKMFPNVFRIKIMKKIHKIIIIAR